LAIVSGKITFSPMPFVSLGYLFIKSNLKHAGHATLAFPDHGSIYGKACLIKPFLENFSSIEVQIHITCHCQTI